MDKKYIRDILDRNIYCLAIIGMAKNSGKTVAFNTFIQEGNSLGLKMALISYGRDGEEIDSLTLKKKPRIKVSPGNIFVTAEKVYKASGIKAQRVRDTGYSTIFGGVNIYLAEERGNVELIGINSISQLQKTKTYLSKKVDMVFIDGALDRRSSAVPNLAEGIILSTGAVIANTIDMIVEKTLYEIRRLSIPNIEEGSIRKWVEKVLGKGTNALLDSEGKSKELESSTSFSIRELHRKLKATNRLEFLVLKGAFVDRFANSLVYDLRLRDFTIIVRDGTRVFLSNKTLNQLDKANINIKVLNKINIEGITVNPVSPYGAHLNSCLLVDSLRKRIEKIPVYDLMSEEYLSL